jgi:hypothetical protein
MREELGRYIDPVEAAIGAGDPANSAIDHIDVRHTRWGVAVQAWALRPNSVQQR